MIRMPLFLSSREVADASAYREIPHVMGSMGGIAGIHPKKVTVAAHPYPPWNKARARNSPIGVQLAVEDPGDDGPVATPGSRPRASNDPIATLMRGPSLRFDGGRRGAAPARPGAPDVCHGIGLWQMCGNERCLLPRSLIVVGGWSSGRQALEPDRPRSHAFPRSDRADPSRGQVAMRSRDARPGQSPIRRAVKVTLLSSPTFRPWPASQMIVSPGRITFEKSVFSTFASATW